MIEIYILEIILWLAVLFSLTSGIVFVVYSLSGGKHEVLDSDRNSFDNRWDNFLGMGDGKSSEQARPVHISESSVRANQNRLL